MKTPRKNSSWYALYADDFDGGTRNMTPAGVGAYVRLLNEQFRRGYIPADERAICRIVGMFPDEWDDVRDEVLAKFEQIDDGLANGRMESERNEREGIRQMKVAAARESHESRRKNNSANCKTPPSANCKTPPSANCKTPPSANCVHDHDHVTVSKDTVEGTALPFGPGFKSAWDDWIAYRREARFPKWQQRTIDAQLERLGKLTEPQAVEAIRQSIANGWRGLFPEKAKAHNSRPTRNGAANAKIAAQVAAQPPGANNRIGDEQF